jgi:hypothetical protein
MPSFDFQSLLWWGLPLVAVPIVIHLINLLRHKRVRWAAMEFLLASQRKFRTRVLLKQLLLLLLRVAAVLGIVLALAGPRWTSPLAGMLGGGRTAHVVLLDDSFSMGDAAGAGATPGPETITAFDRGRRVVERIAVDLATAAGRQELSIGRFARLALPSASGAAPGFDLTGQTVSPAVVQQVRDLLATFAVSATDCGPQPPLAAAAEALGGGAAGVVWLVSDFRARDWKGADDLADQIRRLADAGVQVHLVDCATDDDASFNLSIERLEPVGGVPAVDVVVPMEVTVRNHGTRPVRDVQVDLWEDGGTRPGVRLGEIAANGTAKQRFDARFGTAGGHTVEARIGADAVPADNRRTAAVEVADRVDVLLIDGSLADAGNASADRERSGPGDAFYLAAALAPGAGAPTGLRPRIEPPGALATVDLNAFAGVWLLDVERLEADEIAPLEQFAADGGGVVFFVGPRTNPAAYTQSLHRDGSGLFPVPLAGAIDLLPDAATAAAPDVVVEDHPVVAVLSGQRNPLLDAVRVDRFMAVERTFSPRTGSGLRRLLSLRTGAPFVVEQPFGDGLVVTVLSSASPQWNTWARGNPSWVVVMLELQNHLARTRRRAESLVVGSPVTVRLEPGTDEIEVDFAAPPDGGVVHVTGTAAEPDGLVATLPATVASGPCVARWRRLDGSERERLFAVNVNPAEGSLERMGRDRLDRALVGIPFLYDGAESLQPEAGSLAGIPLLAPLLHALLIVLVLEQLLASAASYLPRSKAP